MPNHPKPIELAGHPFEQEGGAWVLHGLRAYRDPWASTPQTLRPQLAVGGPRTGRGVQVLPAVAAEAPQVPAVIRRPP